MKKYIDVDEIQNIITNCIPLVYFMANTVNGAYENEIEIAKMLASKGYSIETIPMPKKIKHGKWIEDNDGGCHCSVCKWYTDYDYDYVTNNGLGNDDFLFCGHCGAKMEKGA